MQSNLNKYRLDNLLRGIQKSIGLFQSQGHDSIYFTAQFFRGSKKQNGIERGDITSFSKQVRTYVTSEEADAARIEFFDESTGKSIYSKALSDLRNPEVDTTDTKQVVVHPPTGLNGYIGLGEAQVLEMVDKKVTELRRADAMERTAKELEELRAKYTTLKEEKEGLEEKIKAKDNLEFYSGILGAAFPGLASLLTGTPLAQAAGFLAGTNAVEDQGSSAGKEGEVGNNTGGICPDSSNEESASISSMVAEFCATLNTQEADVIHLLFMAFEADRNKIQKALHYITTTAPA